MLIAFMDEFGHSGPFISRADRRYNHSPVFGLAGYVLPHNQVRHFATFFFQLKSQMLEAELKTVQDHPATWEKKGTELISTRNIRKYRHVREGILRLLNEIYKYQSPEDSNSSGLYTTVMAHTIRNIDSYCCKLNGQFMMILDQHSDRIRLLESATKTMFSPQAPARCLIEPPFQVESHLYQTIQAADWIATLVGRLMAHSVENHQYADWDWAEKYFGPRIRALSTHSSLWRPSPAQRGLPLPTPPQP
jgi:uncharacterized protein YaaR (DUF327 family)